MIRIPYRPTRSAISPAKNAEIEEVTALMLVRVAIAVRGRSSLLPIYISRKGQTMLAPLVLSNNPQNINQNGRENPLFPFEFG